jgi:hypothetical protein
LQPDNIYQLRFYTSVSPDKKYADTIDTNRTERLQQHRMDGFYNIAGAGKHAKRTVNDCTY